MRVLAAFLVPAAGLLIAALVCAITGADEAVGPLWQGGLLVLALGLVAFGLRFVPARPIGLDRMEGSAFDDPDGFWGRWQRFFREGRS